MYQIKDGDFFHNGKREFLLGQSYYPSFHTKKYPVPPEGDRIGEMKKDLRMMREMGFNHVRFAALGLVKLDETGKVTVDTSFVDAMIEEAEKNELSVSVRLQGYVCNLRDFKNILMINGKGEEQDTSRWADFIQMTLHHEGLREDNAMATKALAKHFDTFSNVVGYQIYNEPHYPTNGFFDYHPLAIAAYRKWLVAKGHMSAAEAENYEPPHGRREQNTHMWALWRLFCKESLTDFLNDSSDAAHEVSPLPTFTCFTADAVLPHNSDRGVDYFANAEKMDILGYTCYINPEGPAYYLQSFLQDLLCSASELQGKKTWCIELDSRTIIPPRMFNKNTYNTIGSGVKGIVFYQWRGDHPSPATPEPNGCGLVNYDGSHTPNFDNAGKMVRFIQKMQDWIFDAKRVHCGAGIFFSDYASYVCDASENNLETRADAKNNSFLKESVGIYSDLRRKGICVDIINLEALEKDAFGLKILFLPTYARISEEEKAGILRFIARGGKVYCRNPKMKICLEGLGYLEYGKVPGKYDCAIGIEDLLHEFDLQPRVYSDSDFVLPRVLRGKDYWLITVTNLSHSGVVPSPMLTATFPICKATLYNSLGDPRELRVEDNRIFVGELPEGGFIIAE